MPPKQDLQNPTDEIVLVRRLQAKDVVAFGEIYERYKRMVFGYCLRFLSDTADAEDAAHSTFMKIQEGIGALKDPTALRSWILRIARNESLRLMRANNRSAGREPDGDEITEHQTPQTLAERREESEIIEYLLSQLRPEYREVLLLREYEDLTYAQISQVTGDTESSVKSRIFKARRRLIDLFQQQFGERNRL